MQININFNILWDGQYFHGMFGELSKKIRAHAWMCPDS
jgi:hypothetical protein